MDISQAFQQLNQMRPGMSQAFMEFLNAQGGFQGPEAQQFMNDPLSFLQSTGFNPITMQGNQPNQQWLASRQSQQQPQGGYMTQPTQYRQDQPTQYAQPNQPSPMMQPAQYTSVQDAYNRGGFEGMQQYASQQPAMKTAGGSSNPDWGLGAGGGDWEPTESDTGGDPQPGDAGEDEFNWGAQHPSNNGQGGASTYVSQGQVPMNPNAQGQMTQDPYSTGGMQNMTPEGLAAFQSGGFEGYMKYVNGESTGGQPGGQPNPPLGGGNTRNQIPNNSGANVGQYETGGKYGGRIPSPSELPGGQQNFSPSRFYDMGSNQLPYAQNYDSSMQALFTQLTANKTDPEKVNQYVQSIQGLNTLPLQNYFNNQYPKVMDNTMQMANAASNRLNNTPTLQNNSTQQNAPTIPNGMSTAQSRAGTLNSNVHTSQMPNVGSFNQYGQSFTNAQDVASGIDKTISDANYTDASNAMGNMKTSVTGPNTQQLQQAQSGIRQEDVGRSFTNEVQRGVGNVANYGGPNAVNGTMQPAIQALQNTQALSLPQGVQYEDSIDTALLAASGKAQELGNVLNNPQYQGMISGLVGDVNESFAEQERQLESALAASGASNSTIANEQRKRLADQKARALANVNLQALERVSGVERENLGALQNAVQGLQSAQLQQGQFNAGNQIAGSQDSQSRAALMGDLQNTAYGQGMSNEQLQLAGQAEKRAGLGAVSNVADQYFGQAMGNRNLDLANLGALDQVANNELNRNIASGQFGNDANLAKAGMSLNMQDSRIQKALAESGMDQAKVQALTNIANSQVGAEQAGRGFDLDLNNQQLQEALAEAGLKREDIQMLAQLAQAQYGMDMSNAGFNSAEDQRMYGNDMNTMLQNENIWNTRFGNAQQPNSQLLSALSGVNVAPGTIGQLQMPVQGPSTAQQAGVFAGNLISNLLPIPFMPRG